MTGGWLRRKSSGRCWSPFRGPTKRRLSAWRTQAITDSPPMSGRTTSAARCGRRMRSHPAGCRSTRASARAPATPTAVTNRAVLDGNSRSRACSTATPSARTSRSISCTERSRALSVRIFARSRNGLLHLAFALCESTRSGSMAGKPKPAPMPAQKQDHQPGRERLMQPRPDYAPKFPGAGRLKGKVALITGGDSGIGRAVAVAMAREGARIGIVYLDEHKDANDTRDLVAREGGQAILLSGDVGDEAFCEAAVEATVEQFGRLDILV